MADGPGEILEHALKMRRLPADRAMDRLLEDNHVTDVMVRELGRLVGEFHLRARTSPEIAAYGSEEALGRTIAENFEQIEPYVGRTLSRGRYDRLRRFGEGFIKTHAAWLQRHLNDPNVVLLHVGERAEFDREHVFHVTGPSGARYRVECNRTHGNVFEVDAQGRKLRGFCSYALQNVPAYDANVAQMLMLQHDDEAFRRVANGFAVAA